MQKNIQGKGTLKSNKHQIKAPVENVIQQENSILRKIIGNHYFFLSLLTLLYVLMLIIVNPIGNFPLNDDWIWSQPVSLLISKGIYNVTNNYAPIIIAQVFWGALFCLFTGFSFTTLRFSTLVLGLAGAIVFYFLMYNLTKNKKLSFLAGLLLIVNPIYFNLSNTFMTDIPFITMALFSMYFFFKEIDSSQLKFLLLATLFSIIATLIRQFGIVIPLAYAITTAIKKNQTSIERLKRFIPVAMTSGILYMVIYWLKLKNSEPNPPHNVSILSFFSDPAFWSSEVVLRGENFLFYTGLLFFPLLLFIKIPSFKSMALFIRIITIVLLLLITYSFFNSYHGFPTVNILNNDYLGPKTTTDTMLMRIPGHDIDHFTYSQFRIIYIMGITGAILLLINIGGAIIKTGKYMLHSSKATPGSGKQFFAAVCTLGYLVLLFAPYDHFDRYLLPLFPLILMVIINETRTNRLFTVPAFIFTCFYVAAILLFSAYGTHDYIAWNRVRWQAVSYLTDDQKVSIHHIDGGYEVNGWLIGLGREINLHKTWGCVDDNEYMITFGEIEGFKVIKQFNYRNYLTHSDRIIYVIQKISQ